MINSERRKPVDWEKNEELLGIEQFMWRKRIVALFSFITDKDKSVLDIGAGNMYLGKLLEEDVKYYPVDYKKRFDKTIVCDLNKHEFPDIKTDVIVCAGIIEYLNDPKWFFDAVMAHSDKIILSYQGREKFPYTMLYTKEIIDYFRTHGYAITGINKEYGDRWTLVACFEKITPDNLYKNLECTGCGACVNACVSNAIIMGLDEEGYYRPKFDSYKCVRCNQCVSKCPTFKVIGEKTYEPELYAAKAKDEIRTNSSSGGAFTILAKHIIEEGGVVYGVSWNENFKAIHSRARKISELKKFNYSKYVQSDVEKTFTQVKQNLECGMKVLFSGCPCQIAGLKSFLGEMVENRNLITIDVLCFGAPSPQAFQQYLNENWDKDNIKDIHFRDKDCGWKPTSYKIICKDGTVEYPRYEEDTYQQAFHSAMFRRNVCSECRYAGIPRQADITLGDFWGIESHNESISDEKGVSAVIANSKKGNCFIQKSADKFAYFSKVPFQWILGKGNRIMKDGRANHPNKNYFDKLRKSNSFNNSVKRAMSKEYDVGIVCTMNHNLGNNMTNYALYSEIKKLGYEPVLIRTDMNPYFKNFDVTRLFLKNPYEDFSYELLSDNPVEQIKLNSRCHTFAVGSDQLFRNSFLEASDNHNLLDFVDDKHYTFSYGTSFGMDEFECSDDGKLSELAFLFNRFNALSVREKTGVNLLEKIFNVSSSYVLDPVFLVDRSEYIQMSKVGKMRLPKKKFAFGYFLDFDEEKERNLQYLNDRYKGSIAILEKQLYDVNNYNASIETLPLYTVEEWLAGIHNCEVFITDSFHGICFALIFQKQFYVQFNSECWRGYTRIIEILKKFGLENRLVNNFNDIISIEESNDVIDYGKINDLLNDEITRSKEWLSLHLKEGCKYKGELSIYDYFHRKNAHLEAKYNEKLGECKKQVQDLLIKVKKQAFADCVRNCKKENIIIGESKNNMNVIAFGMGDCFRRNYDTLYNIGNVKYVCDNNPDKWGDTMLEGVKCISPKQLKEMDDVVVIITVDNVGIAFEIANSLLKMGISSFDHISNFLKNC